jgi:N-sulfoglucosamine sulfohydrolase
VPSRVFTPEEMPIPGFLFDDPVVRKELAHYYSSVRRADDCVAAILREIDASGQRDNTIILFLSDHGMPLPFAKTQVYHHSSNTPLFWIVPGVTKPGTVDNDHMVSAVDLLPTLLDLLGLQNPGRMDGKSFVPLLRGEDKPIREFVIKEYNENSGGSRDPMRAIETKQYLYIYNPWSDGTRVMKTATTGTSTYRRMAELAKTDSAVAARHDLYQHRVVEELYDIANDPNCLVNLIGARAHQDALAKLRSQIEAWMIETRDPMLEVFRKRADAKFRADYIKAQQAEADSRKGRARVSDDEGGEKKAAPKKKAATKGGAAQAAPGRGGNLIQFALPETITAGKAVTLKLNHALPANLGEQVLTVTMKDGNGQRVDRQTVKARGTGVAEVTFAVPDTARGGNVSFAAFVGDDFQKNLHYIQSEPQPTH